MRIHETRWNRDQADHQKQLHTVASIKTTCGVCSGGCGLQLRTAGKQLLTVEGDPDHPVSAGRICPKGKATQELLKAADRLQQPLLKGKRGEWHQISWPQALDETAARLLEIRRRIGAEALAVHIGQAGVHEEFSAFAELFCRLYGSPNYSTAGSHCHTARAMASRYTCGRMPIADFKRSRCVVCWGSNPTTSMPPLAKILREKRRQRQTLIVIDPKLTELAQIANCHLQLRPGTDEVLALAMLQVLISEELYDHAFVRDWTVGFSELRERVLPYTPERGERITGVKAELIRQASRLYAQNTPACIHAGNAVELHQNGFQAARSISILQAISGNLDLPGGALIMRPPRLSSVLKNVKNKKTRSAIGRTEYPLFYECTGHAQGNLFPRAVLQGRPYPLKAMIVAAGNPVLTWPCSGRVQAAMQNLDFLLVIDHFLTETAELATIVMPPRSYFERHELWDNSQIWGEARIGLTGKYKSDHNGLTDWEIWKQLALRIGEGDEFPWPNEEAALDFRLQSMGLNISELSKHPYGYVYGQWQEKKYEQEGFETSSGKVELVSAELARRGFAPLPGLPESDLLNLEKQMSEAGRKLILTSGARTVEYVHSGYHNLESLRKLNPEPMAEMHPQTAAEWGVVDGGTARIENERDSIVIKIRCNPSLLPGVIAVPHGWTEPNVNRLVDDADLDPVTGFPAMRAIAVRVVDCSG